MKETLEQAVSRIAKAALREMAAFVMAEREWVKCSERLPEPYEEVLGFTAYDKGTHLIHIQSDGKWYRNKAITHWRPITLPEQEEK